VRKGRDRHSLNSKTLGKEHPCRKVGEKIKRTAQSGKRKCRGNHQGKGGEGQKGVLGPREVNRERKIVGRDTAALGMVVVAKGGPEGRTWRGCVLALKGYK